MLSLSGRCKVFQKDVDGYVRAEGGVIYVLKRVSEAKQDGDNILGVIRGFGSSQDGLSRHIGTPTVDGEAAAMVCALADASLHPKEVDWIEMHGTGTSLGDPMEVAATRLGYQISSSERTSPLIVTSIKANIGHTESVSAAASLLKVLLAMKYGSIPPQLLTAALNPKLDFNGLAIPRTTIDWKGSLAGISSFGITETNTHFILERVHTQQTPKSHPALQKTAQLYILPFSAKSSSAIVHLRKKHIVALEQLEEQGNFLMKFIPNQYSNRINIFQA